MNLHEENVALVDAFIRLIYTIENRDNSLIVKKDQAEKANKEKNDFLMNVSHELRTPMHAILNFAEMGQRKINDAGHDKLFLYFSRIEESGERLLVLINDILDLAKLESGNIDFNFTENNIKKCIEVSLAEVASLAEAKSIKMTVEADANKVSLIFDYNKIIQVMVNILSNAIKFSPENNPIKISIEDSRREKQDGVLVSVLDNGVGIPKDELENIFGRFVQSSVTSGSGGSGLGLAISREIIEAHSGHIWAEQNEGGGSCLKFFLPYDSVLKKKSK